MTPTKLFVFQKDYFFYYFDLLIIIIFPSWTRVSGPKNNFAGFLHLKIENKNQKYLQRK